ncbi:T9SS type A sorting domain-containing protein [Rufibacter sp. LB8]|uniref:T9SS type A sorting domain-containing protein n=1 Tax=Rufibacter sp. LB8 TaxID=2777781 RepID=UPI00178C6CA2|nr:T9SS type A sorting domain-containing protein [Rufibacter sp. LB8]
MRNLSRNSAKICLLFSVWWVTLLSAWAQPEPTVLASKANGTAAGDRQVSGAFWEQSPLGGKTIRRPGSGSNFYWNNNRWHGYNHYSYQYNAAGFVIEELISPPCPMGGDDSTSANKRCSITPERVIYEYDQFNNRTGYTSYFVRYYFDGEYKWKWEIGYGKRILPTYTNGVLTQEISQRHEGQAWLDVEKNKYTYHSSGKLAEHVQYQFKDGAWVEISRTIREYAPDSNLPISMVVQERQTDAWVNKTRHSDLFWNAAALQTGQHKLDGRTIQEWRNGAWVNASRTATVYQANGSSTVTSDAWVNAAWQNSTRKVLLYDAEGKLTQDLLEVWANNRWSIISGEKITYVTNTDGDITERLIQRYDTNPESATAGTFQNAERWVYDNYHTITSSKEFLARQVEVYPNPVTSKFAIKTDQAAGATVRVLTLGGQPLLDTQLKITGQEFDLSHLPAGTYILQLQSKAGIRTQKIVKL